MPILLEIFNLFHVSTQFIYVYSLFTVYYLEERIIFTNFAPQLRKLPTKGV